LSSRCKNLPPPMPLCMFTEISVKTEEWETQTQIDVLTRLKSMACKGMKTHQQTTHAKQGSYTILKKICKTGESHFHYHQATNLLYNYQQIQSQPIRAHTCNYHKSAYQSP
jgi:hypothetical protein